MQQSIVPDRDCGFRIHIILIPQCRRSAEASSRLDSLGCASRDHTSNQSSSIVHEAPICMILRPVESSEAGLSNHVSKQPESLPISHYDPKTDQVLISSRGHFSNATTILIGSSRRTKQRQSTSKEKENKAITTSLSTTNNNTTDQQQITRGSILYHH